MWDIISSIGILLGGIGSFLLAVAAFRGISAFSKERKLKKSDAASTILARFRCFRDEVIKIAGERHAYQYVSYPKKLISDGTEDEKKVHPELPPRLINSKLDNLKLELHIPVANLHTVSGDIFKLLERLRIYVASLTSAIHSDLTNNKDQLTEPYKKILNTYPKDLETIVSEVEQLLIPIVEFGEKSNFVSKKS